MDIRVSSSEATDLSMVAHRFEEKCEQSSLKGLSSIIDGFGVVLRDTPSEHVNSLLVHVSRREHTEKISAAGSARYTCDAEQPLRSIELWKDVSTDRIMISIAVRLHKIFKMRFKEDFWDGRPVVIQQIVFQMTPVDVLPRKKAVVAELAEEVQHLSTKALGILGAVCDGVRFEDVTTVPKMLTEALLKVVEPLTTSLKLDQVTLSVVLGDDPVAITTTIASEQQLALESALRPGSRALPCVHLELPPGTKSGIEHSNNFSTTK
jgi:hypothetical protein